MLRAALTRIKRTATLEGLIFFALAGVLAAIYYLSPTSFQLALSLDHTDPQLYAFWTNSLVHAHQPWDLHLWGNIIFYLALVFPTWKLYELRDQKRWFWTGFILILVLGPIVSSVSGYLTFNQIPELQIQFDRGFSGVVGAFNGFLIMTIIQTFAREQEEPVAILSAVIYLAYLLLGLGVVSRRFEVAVFGLLLFVGVLVGAQTRHVASGEQLSKWGYEHRALSITIVVAALVSTLAFVAALPPNIVNNSGGLTNVVAHGAGIIFGMMVEYLVRYRYDWGESWPTMPRSSSGS